MLIISLSALLVKDKSEVAHLPIIPTTKLKKLSDVLYLCFTLYQLQTKRLKI